MTDHTSTQTYTVEFKPTFSPCEALSRHVLNTLSGCVLCDDEDNEYYEFGEAGSGWYCCIVEYVIDEPGFFYNTFTNKRVFFVADIKPNIHNYEDN